ncbi:MULTISPECIES: hypothetical protein [unclassified Fusibacter]|uniref:hypothetical protein n=1 Tax=unclassified Fusibacter TaxID=2624464 RepID=UPI001013A19E|nr:MULTISPECIES: hypothetical protein [unclassified Fusibacter]MCK8060116.1 hypothetical protein [Fusibacter sp. A2]NPE22258.1 hypothetical protein [Fusibacter sp. A1]RXV61032.1 hypothetical protein DWB64_10460 [Fusibacter sp. A1]
MKHINRYRNLILPVILVFLLTSCTASIKPLKTLELPSERVDLPIALITASDSDENYASSVQACIQMAALYHGVYYDEKQIAMFGKEQLIGEQVINIESALSGIGARYDAYRGGFRDTFGYMKWIRESIEAGTPVISGIRSFPNDELKVTYDQFVLFVGAQVGELTYYTPIGKQGVRTELMKA